MKSVFKGTGTAMITPFAEDGSVDYPALEKLIDFQIAGGIDALIVLGTTGEAATLTDEEYADVAKFCIDKRKSFSVRARTVREKPWKRAVLPKRSA